MQHAVDRLAKHCTGVCISGTAATLPRITNIPDTQPNLGPAGGIASALEYAAKNNFTACLFTPVDMPLLRDESIANLLGYWRNEPGKIVCARHAQTGRIEALVSIIPTDFLASVSTASESQDRSVQRWIRTQHHQTIDLPPIELANINSPNDLNNAQAT